MRVFCLKAEEIESCWQDFIVLLQRFEACCRDLTADQIVRGVRLSTMQLFGLQDAERVHAFLTTEIHETAQGKVCVLVAACGSAPEADKRALLEFVEGWAREVGCVALRIVGRKGWLRWDRRFKRTGIVAEMAL